MLVALAMLLCAPSAQADSRQVDAPELEVRLNVPSTPENSYLVDFGYGVKLRVPKVLLSPEAARLSQPIKSEGISMTLRFPDMTATDWQSQLTTIIEQQSGEYKPHKDRFKVRVVWLFYSAGELGNLPAGKMPFLDPRPRRIEKNRAIGLPEGNEMRKIPTKYQHLMMQISESWLKIHPNSLYDDSKTGAIYSEESNAPYELFMDCDSPINGIQCVAHVYSKTNHFQWRMIFPPEAIEHTDKLIRAIDKMIGEWSVK